jgi:hypothetical protein
VSASAAIMATKVSAYEQYLGEDSTNVDINSLGFFDHSNSPVFVFLIVCLLSFVCYHLLVIVCLRAIPRRG